LAHQHRVGARCVQLAVGLVGDLERRQRRAAFQAQRAVELRFLRDDCAYRGRIVWSVQPRAQKEKDPFSLRLETGLYACLFSCIF